MSGRRSSAVEKALKLHARGLSRAEAARKAGCSWSSLWRALGGVNSPKTRKRKAIGQ